VVVVGDLNVAHLDIDIFNPKRTDNPRGFTKEERSSFGKTLESGFIDTFRHLHPEKQKFSFWSFRRNARDRDHGWRLDYALASKGIIDKVIAAEIYTDIKGSDH